MIVDMPLHAPAEPTTPCFDPLIVNPGRLGILLALSAGVEGLEFVHLRHRTGLTDGNLASHARRLADGGLIDIAKHFRAGKPVTTYLLTDSGRQSLQGHINSLISAVARPEASLEPDLQEVAVAESADDDWID